MRSCRKSTGPLEQSLIRQAMAIPRATVKGKETRMQTRSRPRFQAGLRLSSARDLRCGKRAGGITVGAIVFCILGVQKVLSTHLPCASPLYLERKCTLGYVLC